jgi:hypothetical protein
MSENLGYDFGCEQSYNLLKDVVKEADGEDDLKQFAKRKELNKKTVRFTGIAWPKE